MLHRGRGLPVLPHPRLCCVRASAKQVDRFLSHAIPPLLKTHLKQRGLFIVKNRKDAQIETRNEVAILMQNDTCTIQCNRSHCIALQSVPCISRKEGEIRMYLAKWLAEYHRFGRWVYVAHLCQENMARGVITYSYMLHLMIYFAPFYSVLPMLGR
jgi:hypothetical protein